MVDRDRIKTPADIRRMIREDRHLRRKLGIGPIKKKVKKVNDSESSPKSDLFQTTSRHRKQNARNTIYQSKTGFRGVYMNRSGKYYAELRYNDINYYLGLFRTPSEAAKAYDRKAFSIHGDGAVLNFPIALTDRS